MDLSQYLDIFIDETKEHIQTLNEQVLILEAEPENIDTINEIFRAAHSLKGMAGTMGFKRMQRLTHDMENVFSEIRNGKLKVNADMIDIVFKCLDAIEGYLAQIQETADEGTEDNEDVLQLLNDSLNGGADINTDVVTESAPAKVVSAEEKAVEGDKRKFLSVPIADFERNAMKEAKDKNMNVFGVTVYIQQTCILKAARAFLVFKGLEGKAEIIKSEPGVQDIEDEKFEFDFSMFLITEKSLEDIKKIIAYVSEIEEVVIEPFEPANEEVSKPKEEKPGRRRKKGRKERDKGYCKTSSCCKGR